MAEHLTLPVCIGGWNASAPLDQMPSGDAIVYDNVVHTAGADVVRNGYILFTADDSTSDTMQYDQLFGHNAGDNSRLIAIQGGIVKIFSLDSTLKLTHTIADASATFRAVQFTDGLGIVHTLIVNGSSTIWDFSVVDGVDTIVESGFTTPLEAQPSYVGVFTHKNRLYFVEKASFSIWYGDVQAISGTLEEFYVGSFFKKSSRIIALGGWTQDAGAGSDDQMAMFSDNGEVLTYTGLSPVSDDWNMSGLFNVDKIINDRTIVPIKADISLGTQSGYVPMSMVLSALTANSVAMSAKINPYIKSKNFNSAIWKMEYWAAKGWLIVNAPSSESMLVSEFHVLNFENNTWSRFLGPDARDFAIVGNRMLFCRGDGIFEFGVGNKDNDAPIKWRIQHAYSDFGVKYKKKIMRWIPHTDAANIQDLYKFVYVDFSQSARTWVFDSDSAAPDDIEAKWDLSKWNQAKWVDLGGSLFSIKTGIAHRPSVYISLGLWGSSIVDTKILSTDLVIVVAHGTL